MDTVTLLVRLFIDEVNAEAHVARDKDKRTLDDPIFIVLMV
jgi:hypothetical protein